MPPTNTTPPSLRSVRCTIRWSPEEWLTVKERAQSAGLPPSTYLRSLALARNPKPPKASAYRRIGLAERRTVTRKIRWTPSEHERVLYRADSLNLPFARYVREVALGHRLKSLADAHLIHHLNRVGNNLNQLARAANTARQLVHRDALVASLTRLDELLLRLL